MLFFEIMLNKMAFCIVFNKTGYQKKYSDYFCIFEATDNMVFITNNFTMTEKKEDFFDKFKKFAEKAENMIDEQVDKLQKSGVIDKISDYVDKAGDFAEEKIDQFKKSEYPGKIDNVVKKTEQKAQEVIKKAEDIGEKISDKVEDFIDDINARTNQKSNKNNDSENNTHSIK